MARTGRRPGATDTREQILEAARRTFSANGYTGATIRAIAAQAQVDPALVHHYFGTKDELFVAALRLPVNPVETIRTVLAGDLDGMGERIVTTLVTFWDDAEVNPLLMVLRSLDNEQTVVMLREFFTHIIKRPLAAALDSPDAELRATLAASQFAGIMIMRYVARLEPLASMPPAELARVIGPNVQRYLTADI